ncbi:MAG: hypothetical protein KDB00_00210, partial [Planctomycetales bacterium]|nr:hypothetical protein [Planctomycetales bacterium]
MYISHFNTFLQGGASTAAQQLHRALLTNGVASRFQYLAGETFSDPHLGVDDRQEFYSTSWSSPGALQGAADAVRFRLHRQAFKRATRGADKGAEIFTSPHGKPSTKWPPLDHPAHQQRIDQQHIIHLHWISKFIDFPSFFGSLTTEQPVVWTLHDMNALTGGCHFSGGCQRFRLGCGNCPQIKQSHQNDMSFRSFETKR